VACKQCVNWAMKPCRNFDSPHKFCHTCGFTKLLHKPAPKLTVIEGGKDDDAARYGAWIEGEQS
jgi:hypothetical protein